MMRFNLMLLVVCGWVGLSGATQWKLVWSDEFNVEGPPDPLKWNLDTGFLRNEELQYYTARPENVRVEDGKLWLVAHKETIRNRGFNAEAKSWRWNREFGEYTSANLTTKGRFSWTYGRMEVRAKLPEGGGVWPAIWTMGNAPGWPACGEIDLMEYIGAEPDILHSGIHFKDSKTGKRRNISDKWPVTAALSGDFHVYALERTAERIDFYLDDHLVQSIAVDEVGKGEDNPFRKPHYLLLNLAMGGWGGEVDDALFPQRYVIDYVRFFTR